MNYFSKHQYETLDTQLKKLNNAVDFPVRDELEKIIVETKNAFPIVEIEVVKILSQNLYSTINSVDVKCFSNPALIERTRFYIDVLTQQKFNAQFVLKSHSIEKLYEKTFYLPSTQLPTKSRKPFTVSQMLSALGYATKVVEGFTNYKVDSRYKLALNAFESINSLLGNKETHMPIRDTLKTANDVIFEVYNYVSPNENEKKERAQMSLVLDLLIDFLVKD